MQSEEDIRLLKDVNEKYLDIYEIALLEQISKNEAEEIKRGITKKYKGNPITAKSLEEADSRHIIIKEYKQKMNERDRLIYNIGAANGRKSALDWVTGDIDDIFDYD